MAHDSLRYGIFILCLAICFIIRFLPVPEKKICRVKPNKVFSLILCLIVIILCTISIGPDKSGYENMFLKVHYFGILHHSYIGWEYLVYGISLLTSNSYIFFGICASLYVGTCYYVCVKSVNNFLPLFIAAISFFGFYSYGVNTIKSGIGISAFLLGMLFIKKKSSIGVVLLVIAFLIHKSTAILIFAFVCAHFINKNEWVYIVWITCLFLGFFLGNRFNLFLGNILLDQERISGYFLATESERYNTGFRWDFVIYSLIPILWGYWVNKLFYKNRWWLIIYKTYVIANSFWLLVITMPFTDRVAYLSWCLMPYLFFIPLLDVNFIMKNKKKSFIATYVFYTGFYLFQAFLR